MGLIDKIRDLIIGRYEKENKSEQPSIKEEEPIKSDFFGKIYNNYKTSMKGNIMSMQRLIASINDNLQKFSERGYCGLAVKFGADNSETIPDTVFNVLTKYYENQGFEVLEGHNFMKICWVKIDDIPYGYYDSSIAEIYLKYY